VPTPTTTPDPEVTAKTPSASPTGRPRPSGRPTKCGSTSRWSSRRRPCQPFLLLSKLRAKWSQTCWQLPGRRLVYRFLAWRPSLDILFRALVAY